MAQVNRLIAFMMVHPVVPSAHQGVLQNWQLVGVVAHVIEQPVDQVRGDFRPPHCHRPCNRAAPLISGHPGDQVLAVIQGFRYVAKLGAVPQEIGPHGEHDINRRGLLLSRRQ